MFLARERKCVWNGGFFDFYAIYLTQPNFAISGIWAIATVMKDMLCVSEVCPGQPVWTRLPISLMVGYLSVNSSVQKNFS